MPHQEGDVLLYQSNDNGEVNVENGLIEMTAGLEVMVYLSLFGGNEDDPGGSDVSLQYWGNFNETDPGRQYRSETQHLLRSLPPTSGNLRKVEEAAKRDLKGMLDAGIITELSVSATIPAVNRVQITTNLNANGESVSLVYLETWKASV